MIYQYKFQSFLIGTFLVLNYAPIEAHGNKTTTINIIQNDSLKSTRNFKILQTKSLTNGTQPIDTAKTQTIINEFPDYPKYVNTGNLEKDQQDFNKRKLEWIKANPEKYKLLISPIPQSERDNQEMNKKIIERKEQ